ncbi:hypothetical protein G6F57_015620 [Rhizopus arrhizus]|uniref:Uncharacterized protein n=1 Tax=Rhizopus oryzae TaxID=64495 RepID=A0A9P6WWM3_RHIOR|nr:hypothetical protein G6F30_011879 [Rhizopus arrhizus]KAG1394174.1 hypothetical protein G6F58_012167 [Rhizopus delemar]KAG0974829.1 hypothetical protein G6F29_011952 [Rhizopus arrhizus]KAG0975270.1 hypothetical protein G6F28_012969 [Rhizopus arrhizus]KAG1005740.1 hypothetical protein G6F27_008944 [Rhizopus arrhizus]
MKWIEVIHGSVGSTKIDGLVEAKENEELLLIFEFAGGNVSAFNSKFDNDVQKVYTNALHVLETRQQLKIFTAAYFDNKIILKVLKKLDYQFVRYLYVTINCPTNTFELRKFVTDINKVLAWARDLGESARAA